jgi:hypothetical protein
VLAEPILNSLASRAAALIEWSAASAVMLLERPAAAVELFRHAHCQIWSCSNMP